MSEPDEIDEEARRAKPRAWRARGAVGVGLLVLFGATLFALNTNTVPSASDVLGAKGKDATSLYSMTAIED